MMGITIVAKGAVVRDDGKLDAGGACNRTERNLGLRVWPALALFTVLALYARTLWFGFDWDDYHFVRTYTVADVGRAFVGPWDPSGIEARFYRPLTIFLYASRSWIGGHDPIVLHAFSLALMTIVASLVAVWFRRLQYSWSAAAWGMVAFVAHPMVASTVAWTTNQMHLFQLLLVIGALIVATDAPARWPWVLGLQALALLVKEDSVVLAVVLPALWYLRGHTIPHGWLLGTFALTAGYLLVRTTALGGLGGYGQPSLRNLVSGPGGAIFIHPFNGGLAVGLAFVAVVVFALVRGRWPKALLLAGVLLASANAPLAFSSGPNRWHLLALGIGATVAGVVDVLAAVVWIQPVVALMVLGFMMTGWTVTNRWAPCGWRVRAHDANSETWGSAVDPERQALLLEKSALCHDSSDPR